VERPVLAALLLLPGVLRILFELLGGGTRLEASEDDIFRSFLLGKVPGASEFRGWASR